MKLIIAIVPDDIADAAIPRLVEAGHRVTRVASTGGFLRRGNTTLLLGLPPDQVDPALSVLRGAYREDMALEAGRGTAFILEVDRFEQL
jgi:uncharacterized protein YaaQ